MICNEYSQFQRFLIVLTNIPVLIIQDKDAEKLALKLKHQNQHTTNSNSKPITHELFKTTRTQQT